MPTISPDFISRSTEVRAFLPFPEYEKLTFSNETEPSVTTVTGFSGLVTVGFSSSTSVMRIAEARAMVIITITIATIMKLIKICMV